MNTSTANRIRDLNDLFRSTYAGGRVFMTDGVASLPEASQAALHDLVRQFGGFTSDNDPHGEHDFGTLDLDGESYFWKIDYYDGRLEGGSTDPADPSVTTRVLTIMRADEY